MTVREIINELIELDPDYEVYIEAGDIVVPASVDYDSGRGNGDIVAIVPEVVRTA